MKHLILFSALFFLICCQEKQEEKDIENRFFSASKLDELNIDKLTEFFGAEELRTYVSPFKYYSGYVDGIGYENIMREENNGKGIFVSVFESQEKALECMQIRINTVSGIIERGVTSKVDGIWWFSDNSLKTVFKNQWNTMIEVYCFAPDFEILYSTINEVSRKIDDLSEKHFESKIIL
jgi:hypothetical protein